MRRPSLATRIVDERARCHARQQGNVTVQIHFYGSKVSRAVSRGCCSPSNGAVLMLECSSVPRNILRPRLR